MHSDEEFEPEKWTFTAVGGMNMAISPDGDSTVAIWQGDDTDFTIVNNHRSRVSWLDIDFSEETPINVSDESFRGDEIGGPEPDDGDYVYVSMGSAVDEAGDYLYPVEMRMPRYMAFGLIASISMFLGDS